MERRLEETKRLGRVIKIVAMVSGRPNSWKRAALATYFEVTERSIDRDLELLRGLGYETIRSANGYAFTRAPALPAVQLSLPETLALLLEQLLNNGMAAAQDEKFAGIGELRALIIAR